MQLESSVILFDDNKVEDRFAELQITADGITSEVSRKVGNDEVISRINQSAEGVQIQANKVNIEGAAIFSSGRLSQSSLNNAYDANGAAAGEVNNLKSDLSSSAGTTVINGGHIATGSLAIGTLDTDAQNAIDDAGKKASTYITDIGSGGISVHASSNPNSNYVQIDGSGMDVYNGGTSVANFGVTARIGKPETANTGNVFIDNDSVDIRKGSDVLATFGTDGLQVGKSSEKHIGITSQDFTVFEEDGSTPFSVSTEGSKISTTRGAGTAINKSSDSYHEWNTQIYLRGTLSDSRVYFGTSTSAYPTTFTNYITLPSNPTSFPTPLQTITVNGIRCSARWQTRSVVYVKFENTTSTRTNVAYRCTDSYYNTSVKVNDATLNNAFITTLLKDDIGKSKDTMCYVETYGHIAMLCIGVYNTSSILAKGTIYSGTLMSYLPELPTSLVGVYGGEILIGRIGSDGHISVWNSTGSPIISSDSNPLALFATYIFK